MSPLPLLLEAQTLAEQLPLNNVLIIDQSKLDSYLQHHIPGAVHLDFKRLQLGIAPTPGALPSLPQLSEVFSALGLTPDTHVIAYDDEGGGWAGRLIWVLDMIGHRHYSYLNGGIKAWLQDGLPTEAGNVTPVPSSYQVEQLCDGFSLSKDDILARIGQPDFAIWDARSQAEYCGDKVISSRGGHIPGAVNYEWTRGMDPENGLRINPLEPFRVLLSDMGLTADKEIATHCQTHHRSGYTYLVGKILGLNIKAYPGSWSEWGNDPNTPVTTGDQP
ncbi:MULTISPECIES: sulfurtransferase [unclassified Oceanobacter]|uniref:sulfurtransferase n=1 Tax=unclassified Oceanobacter TaxID=2620260 RepID=UPI002733E65D|nr:MULTISPECIES: rhodanese-like domain-containing protein [unclassified Oceanobacter]MDP2608957.1 rhodanese-like domain-containing protein [Oceanobacter sp. 1_MG-2023]MDP2612058.1 rhodanese-like domain-containing protein [Oceanobacter sp. 2_MG-2023]